jgi:voltage-gated potassium channel
MDFTVEFFRIFAYITYLIAPILVSLSVVIIGLGQVVGRLEGWNRADALYWSMITATTVGYGDIRPKRHLPRMLSIIIAILGVIFTGILVSIAIESTSQTFKLMTDPEAIDQIKQHFSKSPERKTIYPITQ